MQTSTEALMQVIGLDSNARAGCKGRRWKVSQGSCEVAGSDTVTCTALFDSKA